MENDLPSLRPDQCRCRFCDAICVACEDKLCAACRDKEDAYTRADFEYDRGREQELITGRNPYDLNPWDDGWDD